MPTHKCSFRGKRLAVDLNKLPLGYRRTGGKHKENNDYDGFREESMRNIRNHLSEQDRFISANNEQVLIEGFWSDAERKYHRKKNRSLRLLLPIIKMFMSRKEIYRRISVPFYRWTKQDVTDCCRDRARDQKTQGKSIMLWI